MEQVIDPVLADLQVEYSKAHRRGQTWRRRWILLAGYVAFLKVIIVCGCDRSMRTLRDWSADDRQALGRTIALSAAAMLVVTALIAFLPMLQLARRHENLGLLVYQIPQALPIAVPVGFTLGLFCGLGGRVVSCRLADFVLATALVCSLGSFTAMVWIMPAANDAFLQSVAKHVSLTKGTQVSLTRGPTELTFSELSQQVDAYTKAGRVTDVRKLRFAYHMRWALPCATFALTLFALCVMPRGARGRWMLGVAACGACFGYYVLLVAGEFAARQGTLPAFAGAWLPNVVFAVAAAGLLMAGTLSQDNKRSGV